MRPPGCEIPMERILFRNRACISVYIHALYIHNILNEMDIHSGGLKVHKYYPELGFSLVYFSH